MKVGGDPTANQASFEAGELDMLAASPPDVPRIKGDAELGPLVTTLPTFIFDYWGFWTKKGPTANKHLRRALSMAIDKDTMMATVYGGQGEVAGSPIPPGMPGHQPDIGLKYDVTAAKAELATALTELGLKDVSELPVLSFGFNTDAGHEVTAAYMQGQWLDNLGVKTELKGETFALFSKDRPKGVFSIARNAWGADYPHPDNILRVLFRSDSGNNDEGYNNPDFDKLIDQAGAEPDIDKAVALLQPGPADPRGRRTGGDDPLARQQLRGPSVGQGCRRHRPGLGRDRRLLLRRGPDRKALGASAPRNLSWVGCSHPTPRAGPSIATCA